MTAARSCFFRRSTTRASALSARTSWGWWSRCGPRGQKCSGQRPDVDYVLIFENRGRDVGATISHPHGQIYSFGYVPPVPSVELRAPSCAICDELSGKGAPGASHRCRVVASSKGWQAWTVWAPSYPYELLIAPKQHLGDLAEARPSHDGLVTVLKKSLTALDALFDEPMPYMLWCHQRPTDGGVWPTAHVHFHVAPTRRDKGVARFVASGELGSGVMFNPVDPEDAACRLKGHVHQVNRHQVTGTR